MARGEVPVRDWNSPAGLGDTMFTLLKVVVEGILTLLVFFGGMKFQQHYPNFIARVDSILAWIKNILPGTVKS